MLTVGNGASGPATGDGANVGAGDTAPPDDQGQEKSTKEKLKEFYEDYLKDIVKTGLQIKDIIEQIQKGVDPTPIKEIIEKPPPGSVQDRAIRRFFAWLKTIKGEPGLGGVVLAPSFLGRDP